MSYFGKLLHDNLWSAPEDKVGCPELAFENVDQPTYDKLLAEANSAGVDFNGSLATFKGCKFDWNYVPQMKALYVTCTAKPWDYPCGTINGEISKLVQQARTGI